jgi:hypothetical protein
MRKRSKRARNGVAQRKQEGWRGGKREWRERAPHFPWIFKSGRHSEGTQKRVVTFEKFGVLHRLWFGRLHSFHGSFI